MNMLNKIVNQVLLLPELDIGLDIATLLTVDLREGSDSVQCSDYGSTTVLNEP